METRGGRKVEMSRMMRERTESTSYLKILCKPGAQGAWNQYEPSWLRANEHRTLNFETSGIRKMQKIDMRQNEVPASYCI